MPVSREPFSVSYTAIANVVSYDLIPAQGAGKLIVIDRVESSVPSLGGTGVVSLSLFYYVSAADAPTIIVHSLNQIVSTFTSDFTGITYPFFGGGARKHRQLILGAGDADIVARGSLSNIPVRLSTAGVGATLPVQMVVYGHVVTL